ncbi:MAG: TonB-dependent siderophore receptor [Blastocatellia bacterium]|nr:TonB-dependent siderophore receptor [Blastocatellia bacterium]
MKKKIFQARQSKKSKTLLALGTLGTLLIFPTFDNTFKPVYAWDLSTLAAQTQENKNYNFNIPASTVGTALADFEKTTGQQILISNNAIKDIASPGVTGSFSPEEALKQILKGTNVTYKTLGTGVISIELTATSDVIEVTDNVQILTSPKFTEPLRDTPQTINIVSKQTLQDQGVTTLRDALRNVAGVSLAAGEGGNQGDNLTIRGFGARNDLFIDGMRDFGNYFRDSFNVEQVEVLKGPSSVTVGRGSTGGAVNQSYKTPQLRSFVDGTVEFGSDETKRVTLDINEPVAKLGKNTAFRLNLMGHYSQVAERDIAENRRYGFAPSLAFGIGTKRQINLNYFHQSANDIPDYGILYLFDRPAPVDRSNYYGFRNANFLRTNVDIGSIKYEEQFNDNFGIRNQLRYTKYTREGLITAPRNTGTVTLTTPLDQIRVNRNQVSIDAEESFLQNQFDVTTKFQTGFIKYTIVAGLEGSRETSKVLRLTFTGVPTASLLNPNTNEPFSGISTATSNTRTTSTTFATYFLGTVKLAERVELVGGVRFDRFDVNFEQFLGTPPNRGKFNRLDEVATYRGALVIKPMEIGSLYFSYSTSFNPSAEAFALNANTTNIKPEENRTFEVGTKWDLLAKRFSVRAAAFRVEKTNARETDPRNPLLTVLAGAQRIDGFEFETNGRITDKLQINTSYAFLDSEVSASRFFPDTVGNQLANVPKHTASINTTYDLPFRLNTGVSIRFVDSRNASSTAPTDPITGRIRKVDSYTVADMFVKRRINEHAEIQVNVYNLSNKFYIDQPHPAHLVPGAGRSVKVGLNFKLR